jgi:hypothetical protein
VAIWIFAGRIIAAILKNKKAEEQQEPAGKAAESLPVSE